MSRALGCALLALTSVACAAGELPRSFGRVDEARLRASPQEPQNWLALGRDRSGAYYSPLADIDEHNVKRLGFAWDYDLGTFRGQEASPVVVDGVMYTSGTWGYVYALNAATGRELWKFDPKVHGQAGRYPCCDLLNRGVAVWDGRVYVAAVDGRLFALDAASGAPIWEVDTIIDHGQQYSSTGAPQIAGRSVVIGNGGGDMGVGGVRGYVSAYDLTSGELRWRFFTVPGAPGAPLEHPELKAASATWDPKRNPQFHGGGTVWDGMAYDPDLNLVYIGTGNAAPYDSRQRGRTRQDNLFVASIIALNADTGRMAWYYQATPGDEWDYDAVQKFVLAELRIGGKPRKVLMQANKNGFFYVLDRASGKLYSARNFATVTWASRVDLKTGRPVLAPAAEYHHGPVLTYPSVLGAHTWPPMSFSPRTGLVYIPVNEAPNVFVDLAHNGGSVNFLDGFFTVNGIIPDKAYDPQSLQPLFGKLPVYDSRRRRAPDVHNVLRAWDPTAQKTVWEKTTSDGYSVWDGGILSTAGNLVFQGLANGDLCAYTADRGRLLTCIPTGSHLGSAPITYAVDGTQYVAVQAGYGGVAIYAPIPPTTVASKYLNENRIIAFRLDGGAVPKPPERVEPPVPAPPQNTAAAQTIAQGERLFTTYCSRCHVFGPSITPDLRRIDPAVRSSLNSIVLGGQRAPNGMGRFDDVLSESDLTAISSYLLDQAWQLYRQEHGAAAR
ncbi:MAG TPA: PQQ-dependent dehydrogenase, methanol/ethanol family [Burkholderiaceae bacterium]|nr:PQQ-dependent dehydrogenase, methanol/ethanol family [Burkholderiaceae bacterium]